MNELILQPIAAMVLLTLLVGMRLYFTRIPEITRRGIKPRELATRARKNTFDLGDAEARASDNYQNLFELPILFYALCLAIHVSGASDTTYVLLAWLFVASRAAHSFIHLFYNNVVHRLIAYLVGFLVLWAAVTRFAIDLVQHS